MTDLPPTEDASAAALPIIDAGSANDDAPTAAQARTERRLQVRAALLLIATVALLVCSGLYLMWIRGAFEETQRLILLSDDAEGVQVGMDMTFAGFPIGRVRSFGLGEDARVRIVVSGKTPWEVSPYRRCFAGGGLSGPGSAEFRIPG